MAAPAAAAARPAAEAIRAVLFEDLATLRGRWTPRTKRERRTFGTVDWTVHVNPLSLLVAGGLAAGAAALALFTLGQEVHKLGAAERQALQLNIDDANAELDVLRTQLADAQRTHERCVADCARIGNPPDCAGPGGTCAKILAGVNALRERIAALEAQVRGWERELALGYELRDRDRSLIRIGP